MNGTDVAAPAAAAAPKASIPLPLSPWPSTLLLLPPLSLPTLSFRSPFPPSLLPLPPFQSFPPTPLLSALHQQRPQYLHHGRYCCRPSSSPRVQRKLQNFCSWIFLPLPLSANSSYILLVKEDKFKPIDYPARSGKQPLVSRVQECSPRLLGQSRSQQRNSFCTRRLVAWKYH